jgi:hypothetical protein
MTAMAVVSSILNRCARLRPTGFTQLSLFLGIILLATPLRQERRIFWLLLQLAFLDALLVSLSASGARRGLRAVLLGVWAAGFGANLGATLTAGVESTPWWSLATSSLAFILLTGCAIAVLAYIFRSHRVTLDVMLAAVTAYLLIALSFAGTVEAVRTEMVYFSLVTLATLGYGDILPRSPFTQMLAVLEAVIGQFFMTVLVAWLVGIFISHNFVRGR